MDFGSRLRLLRKEAALTQSELAKVLDVAESAVSMWELGKRRPDYEMLEAIADYFNVDMNYLLGQSDVRNQFRLDFGFDNILFVPNSSSIPILGTIACGDPILAEENIEGEVNLPEYIHADFALRCKGDSMINARIHDGDIVYIRQQPTVNNGEIAAVLIDDEATLKRVYIGMNSEGVVDTLILQPANPRYQPMFFKGEELEAVRILGKAVGFTSTDI